MNKLTDAHIPSNVIELCFFFLWHRNNPAFPSYASLHTSSNKTNITVLAVYACDTLKTAKWTCMLFCFQATGSDDGQSMGGHFQSWQKVSLSGVESTTGLLEKKLNHLP